MSISAKSLSPNQRFLLNFLPALYFIGLLSAWFGAKNFGFGYRPLVYAGLSVGLAGLVLWLFAMVHLGKSLAVLPGGNRVVASGVYKYLRHPLYLGITLTFFGLFLAIGSTVGMVYLFVIVIPLNLGRARREETALIEQMGDTYRDYMKKTIF